MFLPDKFVDNIRLQEETAKVEKCLLEGNFIASIVRCFNAPKASAFDYNLLEPLQKLLRLSSPVASSLARSDLFNGILQKLNHKKAVVRLNLLRIVRSICDPTEDQADVPRRHDLFEAIQRLSESDNAVLVRNMANELVKSNLSIESDGSSGERQRRGQLARRQSSFSTANTHQAPSIPLTPTQKARKGSQSSTFLDRNVERAVTPRRLALTSNTSNTSTADSFSQRPQSRESIGVPPRRTSSDLAGASSSAIRRPPSQRSDRSQNGSSEQFPRVITRRGPPEDGTRPSNATLYRDSRARSNADTTTVLPPFRRESSSSASSQRQRPSSSSTEGETRSRRNGSQSMVLTTHVKPSPTATNWSAGEKSAENGTVPKKKPVTAPTKKWH